MQPVNRDTYCPLVVCSLLLFVNGLWKSRVKTGGMRNKGKSWRRKAAG